MFFFFFFQTLLLLLARLGNFDLNYGFFNVTHTRFTLEFFKAQSLWEMSKQASQQETQNR